MSNSYSFYSLAAEGLFCNAAVKCHNSNTQIFTARRAIMTVEKQFIEDINLASCAFSSFENASHSQQSEQMIIARIHEAAE